MELSNEQKIGIVNGHITELLAEQYSHQLRIIEFDGAGRENINPEMYQQMVDMVAQYDLRIAALQAEKDRLSE